MRLNLWLRAASRCRVVSVKEEVFAATLDSAEKGRYEVEEQKRESWENCVIMLRLRRGENKTTALRLNSENDSKDRHALHRGIPSGNTAQAVDIS